MRRGTRIGHVCREVYHALGSGANLYALFLPNGIVAVLLTDESVGDFVEDLQR
jgi:hypothetical protein